MKDFQQVAGPLQRRGHMFLNKLLEIPDVNTIVHTDKTTIT